MKYAITLMMMIVLFSASQLFAAETAGKPLTIDNLKAAFTGETTAGAKYAAYAKKAKEEGYLKVALLFEAASRSEAIHAGNHRAVLEQLAETAPEVNPKFEVKSTLENLQDALAGETYEVATMYPQFLQNASASKSNLAGISFNYAYQTEQNHKLMYAAALDAMKKGTESSLPGKYVVCGTCGNTYANAAPKRCEICMSPQERYITIM